MRSHWLPLLILSLWSASHGFAAARDAAETEVLRSPHGNLQLTVSLNESGAAFGVLRFRENPIGTLAFGLKFTNAAPLQRRLRIVETRRRTHDETYSIPVGKTSSARDHYQEVIVTLEEAAEPKRRFEVACRAFDDGLAFRYQLPEQESLKSFELTEELTQFNFPENPTAHLLPLNSHTTPYEKYYETRPVNEIDRSMLIGVPMLMNRKGRDGQPLWFAITEANLIDYAGMYLAPVDGQPGTLISKLSPLPGRNDGVKVVAKTPHNSPWRVLMIADNPGRLIESNLVFNLSEPSRIADTSWIKPGRTTFPWWNGYVLEGVDFKPGLNTATMKHYIDFCAENGIEYHSLDGTDTAWYGGPIAPNGPTDITKSVPEIDLPEVLRYAKEKGVRLRLWMHWIALKRQLDEALPIYEKWGIEGIMVDFMDRDDQEMVAWYQEVAEKCAKHHLTVTWHGAYKPVGMERTWPNVLTSEAVLNQEFNKWDKIGTPPEHNLNVAFIRTLAGPLDYHQGGMRTLLPENHKPIFNAPMVQGTRGHQLAMFVVYENHLPMLADYPAAYRGQPGLEFLCKVPCNWDETKVLHAEFGKCIVVARRKGDTWYLGGMTAGEKRTLELPLSFLNDGSFDAEVIEDDPEGPTMLTVREESVARTSILRMAMPRAGGFVAKISATK